MTALGAQESDIPDMVLGSQDAKVEIIEYASYTCPHCASFHANAYKDLKKDYIDTGRVKFTYREVYFDRYGLWASMVARCAGPERFFGVTDMLYAEQQNWARAGDATAIVGELRKIGKVAGLTDEMLDACLQDADKAQALVTWYQGNAERDDINSTPSFVINGTKYNNMSYSEMSSLIDGMLE
ncbi:MAG: DsbA family protein [Pseudomonadota bacterium]